MDNRQLFSKASQAAYNYRTVYGSFPEKIGIHHQHLQYFDYRQIVFPEQTELPLVASLAEPPPLESITYRHHVARFEPIVGQDIEDDEVYVPVPGSDTQVMSSVEIERQAQRIGLVKEAIHSPQVKDEVGRALMRQRIAKEKAEYERIRRMIEADHMEELDVCGDCYRHYLPMRKLQEIYPDWPPSAVPQCEYCQEQAKYHVKRSDWITFEKAEVSNGY